MVHQRDTMKIYKLDSNVSQMEIDLSEYNNGLYVYMIQSSDGNVRAQGKLSLIK